MQVGIDQQQEQRQRNGQETRYDVDYYYSVNKLINL